MEGVSYNRFRLSSAVKGELTYTRDKDETENAIWVCLSEDGEAHMPA